MTFKKKSLKPIEEEPNILVNYQDKNEILLNLNLIELKNILRKYTKNLISKKVLTASKTVNSFGDITSENKSYLYYVESERKLIINYLIQDNYNELLQLSEAFFKDLSKHAWSDFKIVFLDRNTWKLSFCVYSKGEIHFHEESVSKWEDPQCFDSYPYFVKIAKANGLKKKKNTLGNKIWDSEEIYDLIYDFRDNLASGFEYENIAPEWYIKLKTIPD